MTFSQVIQKLSNQYIFKPEGQPCLIKGAGIRRGGVALIYCIPSKKNKMRFYEKGFNKKEYELALNQLLTGSFTREFFNSKMKECSKEGGCTYTTIGGIFQKLGIASYQGRKEGYVLLRKPNN